MTAPLRPLQALAIFFAALAAFLAIGPLALPLGLAGLALAHVFAIVGVPLAAVRLAGAPILPSYGLTRPRALACAGATLVGVSFWYVNASVVGPIAEQLLEPGEAERLAETFLPAHIPLALVVLATVVIPSIGEELLMRGLLLRAFAPRTGRVAAVALSALLFGVLHLSAARMLMTTALGLVLGYLSIASGSVIPAIIGHALNNLMAVAIGMGALPWIVEDAHATPTLIGALALTVGGLVLVHVGRRTDPPPAPDRSL